MGISRPRLARDMIKLLIAVIRLIIAILTFVGGATNYACQCLARTSINSLCRTATRYSFHLTLAETLVKEYKKKFIAGGDRLITFTTFAAVDMSLR